MTTHKDRRLTFHISNYEASLLTLLSPHFPDMNHREICKVALNLGLIKMLDTYNGLEKTEAVKHKPKKVQRKIKFIGDHDDDETDDT